MKINATDEGVLWQKTYGGSRYDPAFSVAVDAQGNIVTAGCTNSSGAGGYDFYVLKLDSNGNVLWAKTYGGTGYDYALSVTFDNQGNIVTVGTTESFGAKGWNIWVLKLDATTGNPIWQRAYGGENDDYGWSVAVDPQGNIVASGSTYSFGAGDRDFWVLCMSSEGKFQYLTSTFKIDDTSVVPGLAATSTSNTRRYRITDYRNGKHHTSNTNRHKRECKHASITRNASRTAVSASCLHHRLVGFNSL